jgi:hypothetical protein
MGNNPMIALSASSDSSRWRFVVYFQKIKAHSNNSDRFKKDQGAE